MTFLKIEVSGEIRVRDAEGAMMRWRPRLLTSWALIMALGQSAAGGVVAAQDLRCFSGVLPGSFSWSPNGDQIVFTGRMLGLRLLSLASGKDSGVAPKAFFGVAAWANRSEVLAILSANKKDEQDLATADLFVLKVGKDRSPRSIAGGLSANLPPKWSPDDKWVLVQDIHGSLLLVDPNTGARHLVYESRSPETGLNGEPVWTDVSHIVAQVGSRTLVRIEVNSGTREVLSRDTLYAQLLSRGDGRLWGLAYTEKKFRLMQLYAQPTLLAESSHMYRVSGPDKVGRVVTSLTNGNGFLFINSLTGASFSISNRPGDSDPQWSPANSQIAFFRVKTDNSGHSLCIMPIESPQ
jgi:hypothetical protein